MNTPPAPFHDNLELFNDLKLDLQSVLNDKLLNLSESEAEEKMKNLCSWLSATPQSIVYRVNTLLTDKSIVLSQIQDFLLKSHSQLPTILTFPHVPELIVIQSWESSVQLNLEEYSNYIIVDEACGAAVLRGAHVYAPGIIGMPHGLKLNEVVSVYAASSKHCKKGLIKLDIIKNKLYIGNGVLKMNREHIFSDKRVANGIAVSMISAISRVPQLSDSILPEGHLLLQNLPSIICSRILDPQTNENVLDMCAAPGNKTTHIGQLMNNEGILIALEKSKRKVERLKRKCKEFGLKNVHIFCVDSTTAVCDMSKTSVLNGPPFSKESFDRILLDGPCSALGQRPQIRNKLNSRELHSFPQLQKNLFFTAVNLLKSGGILVYSTCTITVAENEKIVAWALEKYTNLQLISVHDQLMKLGLANIASPGYNIKELTCNQSSNLCRFNNESVGFFIACFRKL